MNSQRQPQQYDRLYLGALSGTSADGFDIAAVCFAPNERHLVELVATRKFPQLLDRETIERLSHAPYGVEARAMDTSVSEDMSDAINTFIRDADIPRKNIVALGLHGQTIAHRPTTNPPFSRQLSLPNIISKRTRLTVVANFRQGDMAIGGQGAPLAPIFHREIFANLGDNVAVVNIGGIANITLLSKHRAPHILGWDCGPGNTLMDKWIMLKRGLPYDKDGAWANGAPPDQALLDYLMTLPFIRQVPPKSACAGDFTIDFLRGYPKFDTLDMTTIMSTLCEWTAACITNALRDHSVERLIVCGGGALNHSLLQRMRERVACPVNTTLDYGFSPLWIEAMLFAYLAHCRMEAHEVDLRTVTGARRATLLGEVFVA